MNDQNGGKGGVSPVEEELSRMAKQVGLLEERLAALGTRLAPAMRESQPTQTVDENRKAVPPMSHIAAVLYHQTEVVRGMISQVSLILDRLEI